MSDPRVDAETQAFWNDMCEQATAKARMAALPEAIRDSLIEVIDLHIPWVKREQQIGPGSQHSDDVILGIGCRYCGDIPNPLRVDLEYRPCRTIRTLAAGLGVVGVKVP